MIDKTIDKKYEAMLSILGNRNGITEVIADIKGAFPDHVKRESAYERVIKQFVIARNQEVLIACLAKFPPKEDAIRSPFTILISKVREITHDVRELLVNVIAYLEQWRPDLLVHHSIINESALHEAWWAGCCFKSIEHFEVVALHYTFPPQVVENLYEYLKSHVASNPNHTGQIPLQELSNKPEDYIRFFSRSFDLLSHIAKPVGTLKELQWFIDNPQWQRYLRFGQEDILIAEIADHVVGTMPEIRFFSGEKGFEYHRGHPLVILIRHGVPPQSVINILDGFRGLPEHQAKYLQYLRTDIASLGHEMSPKQALTSTEHTFSGVSSLQTLLTAAAASVLSLQTFYPVMTEVRHPAKTH